ncbi:MAG: 6-phosphofructokinase, partial [Ruminococcus sp.]|nr:6-phosphofructokinase [Ruminococcus sp.]
VLATQFGVHAAALIAKDKYGYAVAKVGDKITENKLSDVAGKTKFVPADDQMVQTARDIGISFGD